MPSKGKGRRRRAANAVESAQGLLKKGKVRHGRRPAHTWAAGKACSLARHVRGNQHACANCGVGVHRLVLDAQPIRKVVTVASSHSMLGGRNLTRGGCVCYESWARDTAIAAQWLRAIIGGLQAGTMCMTVAHPHVYCSLQGLPSAARLPAAPSAAEIQRDFVPRSSCAGPWSTAAAAAANPR